MARVDQRADEVLAAVFKEAQTGRATGPGDKPAGRGEVRAEHAIEENHFAVGKRSGVGAREHVVGHAVGGGHRALDKDEPVSAGRTAGLDVVAAAQRARFTAVEIRDPAAPDEIDVAFDVAVGEINRAVDQQGILIAGEVAVAHEAARAVRAQRLGLGTADGRAVAEGKALEREVVRVDSDHGSIVAGVEIGVVGVGDDRLAAVFAAQRDEWTVPQQENLVVGAIAEIDQDGLRIVHRHKVERALHAREVTRAIGGHREAARAGGGPGGLRRKTPGARTDAGKRRAGSVAQRLALDRHAIGLAVGEHRGAQRNNRGIPGDDHRSVVVNRAADRARLRGRREVDRINHSAAGVGHNDATGGADRGHRVEGHPERCVDAHAGSGVGGKQRAHAERSEQARRNEANYGRAENEPAEKTGGKHRGWRLNRVSVDVARRSRDRPWERKKGRVRDPP